MSWLRRLFDWRGLIGMGLIVLAIRVAHGSYDINRWTMISLLLSVVGVQFIREEERHQMLAGRREETEGR